MLTPLQRLGLPCLGLLHPALLRLGFVFCHGLAPSFAPPASAAERPNILFIFTDDHAPHAIGAYGGWLKDVAPTPNLDQLARDGMLFENCFCTNALCGPSRAVVLTGKHSHLNGFRRNGDRFNGAQQTFPKLLQQAGYQTALVGKWHLESEPTGFDHWEVLPGQGAYYNPELITRRGTHRRQGHCTDVVTQLAVEWMTTQRDPKKPFLLMCQHKAPHRTWMPAERHLTLFDDVELPEPPTLFDAWEDNASPARNQEMEIGRHLHPVYDLKLSLGDLATDRPGGLVDKALDKSGLENLNDMTSEQRTAWEAAYGPKNRAFREARLSGRDLVRWKHQRYLKDYLRCVKGVDESVGALRDALRQLGLADNTLVVYSSDQGFFLGDHGWYDKRWMYDESLRMPLIVSWPGTTQPGTRSAALVQNLDFAPTLLEAADAPVPHEMQGASLAPLLRSESPSGWRQAIYYRYYEFPAVHMVAQHYGIRTQRHKLIHFHATDEWEYYDLERDPEELVNAYQVPENATRIAELKEELSALRRQYGDQ